MTDFLQIANRYVDDVLNDVIPASQLLKLAVKRSQADHARTDDWPYYFDPAKAAAPCNFISSLKFATDAISTKAGEPFVLRPDQVWHLSEIFGWLRKDSGDRRFKRAFIECPRGNGKSVEQGSIALYVVATEEGGAQILCAASIKEQARIVLDSARNMTLQDKELRDIYNLEVTANNIKQRHTGNILKSLPATATSVEGTSPNFAVLDELHAIRGRKLFSALVTGCAKKKNSLFVCITTAGDDDASVAFEQHRYIEQILKGEVLDESYFGLIYTSDPEIHWADPLAWRQANPGISISVDLHALEAEANTAMQMPGEKAAFRSRHLNHWIQNDIERPFLDERKIGKCLDANLQPEEGSSCDMGADLASSEDLTVVLHAHPRMVEGKLHVDAFLRAFLPASTFKETNNAAYQTWVESGELQITEGNTTNYKDVEDFVLDNYFKFDVKSLLSTPCSQTILSPGCNKRRPTVILLHRSLRVPST